MKESQQNTTELKPYDPLRDSGPIRRLKGTIGPRGIIHYEYVHAPKRISDFLEAVVALCKLYNLSISHEDYQGAFEVVKYDDSNSEWLMGAYDRTEFE